MKKISLSIRVMLLLTFIAGILCGCKQDKNSFDNAYDILEEYVASGAYKEYITDASYPDGLEYVIYDLNADDIPELLIDAGDPAPFFNTWLFALKDESVVLVTEQYGYGQFRYSAEQNLIIGTPEFRPFDGTGYAPFYQLVDTNIENVFSIVQDLGVWYYDDGNARSEINEAERESYFADVVSFEWLPIEN